MLLDCLSDPFRQQLRRLLLQADRPRACEYLILIIRDEMQSVRLSLCSELALNLGWFHDQRSSNTCSRSKAET